MVSLAFAFPARGDDFTLLHPPENGVVLDREVHVIVDFPLTDTRELAIDVRVDGRATPYRLHKGADIYLHAVTNVATLGLHAVAVRVEGGIGSAKTGNRRLIVWEKNVRFEVSDPLSLKPQSGFSRRPFHDAVPKNCAGAGCHDFKLEKGKPVAAGTGCRGCHKREGDFRHAPMRTGDCAVCHRDDNGRFTPVKTAEETCFYCHEDVKKRMNAAEYTHGPTQLMVCELCHDPHGTRAEMFTWRGRNNLCLTCHDGYDKQPHVVAGFVSGTKGHPVTKIADPLEAGREFACTSCHSPHDAKHPMLFGYDKSDRTELCRMCHDDKL